MRTFLSGLFSGILLVGLVSSSQAVLHEVAVVDYTYIPNELTVSVGDSIRWTNEGAEPHTVDSGFDCSGDGRIISGNMDPGESFVWAAEVSGDYPYFCAYHCLDMFGEFTVLAPTRFQLETWGQIKDLYRK